MDPEREPLRELLRQAITDIQGSIHANDTKSSAALVVQGLLATAVVTLISHLGSVYGEATGFAQVLIKLALGGTLGFGVLSIAFLIFAVMPYEPKKPFASRNARGGVFFPKVTSLKERYEADSTPELVQLRPKFEALNSDEALEDEYLSELLMVADIRQQEAWRAKWGFRLLGLEVIFAVLYLGTVGAVAGHMFGASAPASAASLRWEVIEGGHRRSPEAAHAFVRSHSTARVRLRASDPAGLRQLRLTGRMKYRCARHKRSARTRLGKGAGQSVRLLGAKQAVLVDRAALPRPRCPNGTRFRGAVWRFRAQARSEDGTLTTASLGLRRSP